MKTLLLVLLLFPFLLFAYLFRSFEIGAMGGYRQDEIKWSYGDERFVDPNAISEQFNKLHIMDFGARLYYLSSWRPYLRGKYTYGYSWSNNVKTTLLNQASSLGQAVIINSANLFKNNCSGRTIDTYGALGFTMHFGPIHFAPFFGYSYNRHRLKRKNVQPFTTPTATFFPKDHLSLQFYAPFFGIEFVLTPMPLGRIRFTAGYEYHWGKFKTRSSYFSLTNVTQAGPFRRTVQQIKQNIFLNQGTQGHLLYLNSVIGILSHLTLTFQFQYQYWKSKEGSSDQTLTGEQAFTLVAPPATLTPISQTISRPFNQMKWQSFAGNFILSLTF